MTYQAAQSRSGPLLLIASLATLVAILCALTYVGSLLLTATHSEAARQLGVFSVAGLLITGPLALALSLVVRCRSCDHLLLPLVYDGKTWFGGKSPSAFAILGTAVGVVARRRAPCPHCGAEAQV